MASYFKLLSSLFFGVLFLSTSASANSMKCHLELAVTSSSQPASKQVLTYELGPDEMNLFTPDYSWGESYVPQFMHTSDGLGYYNLVPTTGEIHSTSAVQSTVKMGDETNPEEKGSYWVMLNSASPSPATVQTTSDNIQQKLLSLGQSQSVSMKLDLSKVDQGLVTFTCSLFMN